MKLRKANIFPLIMCLCFLCVCFMPLTTFAASSSATLTVDGVLIGTFASVQQAVDLVETTPGSNFVIEVAEGTVSDPLNILQIPNKNVVLRPQAGATVTFTNTITIDGNGNLNSPETLLIEGFNFDFTAGTPVECIYFNLIPPRVGFCYPHNITINGCNFKGVFGTTVVVQSVTGGSRNIAIMNCTASDVHSLAQLKAVAGYAFIQNCIVSNSAEGGVNFYGPGDLIIDSCKFDVANYAVRSGQGAGVISNLGSVTVNNSILNSSSASDGTIVLRGDSTSNINIVHSNITNTNPAGAAIQNLNGASVDLYDIDIVESNITGQIMGINLSTITTIDDPNVPNGPVSVIEPIEPDNPFRDLLLLILSIPILVIILVILALLLAILIIRLIIRFVRFLINLITS